MNKGYVDKILREISFKGLSPKILNETLYWVGSDTQERFIKNISDFPTNSNLKKYISTPITYKYNNLGFRSDIDYFRGDTGTVFLGASTASGVGLLWEDTFQSIIAKTVGGKQLNLAIDGSGIDSWVRVLYQFKDFFIPKRVVVLGSCWPRYEYITDDGHVGFTLGGVQNNPLLKRYKNFIADCLSHDSQIDFNFNLKLLAIVKLCDMLNAEFYFLDELDSTVAEEGKEEYLDFGRDLMHFGPKWHKRVAEVFLHQIKDRERSCF